MKPSMENNLQTGEKPFISVIIPVYNRRRLVERAIRSIRNQPRGEEVEIVAVDDASTDGSYEFLQSIAAMYGLVVVGHATNQGIGPTRNYGIRKSRGEWIVPLDSDDELAADILQWLFLLIPDLPSNVHRIRGMVAWNDGRLTPQPGMKDEIWEYVDYLRAINLPDNQAVESASIYRRTSLLENPYPADRGHEMLFHLDYFIQFKVRTTARVVRIYHTDAMNSTIRSNYSVRLLNESKDHAKQVDDLLDRHGDALKSLAPYAYQRILDEGVKQHLLCGNKIRAISLIFQGIKPLRPRLIAYLMFGLVGRRSLALAATVLPRFIRAFN